MPRYVGPRASATAPGTSSSSISPRTYSPSMPAAANAALCMTTECRRFKGLPRSTTRRVTDGAARSRRHRDLAPIRLPDRARARWEDDVGDDLADPVAELGRVRRHRVQDELLDPGVDPCLERGHDLVRRPEQVDRLEVVRTALGAHHLEERAVLLLAGLRGVVRDDEVQEVLVGDGQLGRVLAVVREVALELVPVTTDVLGRAGGAWDPAIRAERPRLDRVDELREVG